MSAGPGGDCRARDRRPGSGGADGRGLSYGEQSHRPTSREQAFRPDEGRTILNDIAPAEPPSDCPLCPRLAEFRDEWRSREPEWHNAPVPAFLPIEGADSVRLLIVGLAPGLRGANRTGRPFTGDYAGDLLYATLKRFGFARGVFEARPDDSLELVGTAIVNAVRCVPPQNKPTGPEINTCRQFLTPTIESFPQLSAVVTLGRIAHDSTVRALGARLKDAPFGHGAKGRIGALTVIPSYHCSRYNTNTGVLTTAMFEQVFETAAKMRDASGAS